MSTPGPWYVRITESEITGDKLTSVVAADGTVIADNERYYPQDLNPDNAKLIAAAPEMYAALKEIAGYPHADHAGMPLERCRRLARAAIAKVEN